MIIDSSNAEKFISFTQQLDEVNGHIANLEKVIQSGCTLRLDNSQSTPTNFCRVIRSLPEFKASDKTLKGYMDSLKTWRDSILKDLESFKVTIADHKEWHVVRSLACDEHHAHADEKGCSQFSVKHRFEVSDTSMIVDSFFHKDAADIIADEMTRKYNK